jgi:phosphoribosylformylglycinamidine synthase
MRALLFGEAQGRVIVSTPDPAAVLAIAGRRGVPAAEIGTVGEPEAPLVITIGMHRFEAPLSQLVAAYHGAIPAMMSRVATSDDSETVSTEWTDPRVSSLEPQA